jgi:hypothetical protein
LLGGEGQGEEEECEDEPERLVETVHRLSISAWLAAIEGCAMHVAVDERLRGRCDVDGWRARALRCEGDVSLCARGIGDASEQAFSCGAQRFAMVFGELKNAVFLQ